MLFGSLISDHMLALDGKPIAIPAILIPEESIEAVKRYIYAHGTPSSIPWIAEQADVSPSVAGQVLLVGENEGWARQVAGDQSGLWEPV